MASDTDPMMENADDGAMSFEQPGSSANNVHRSIMHPSRLGYKLVVLVFICFLSFGSYFCYDNPSALQDQIIDDLDISVSQYATLYSIYSWPNVVLSIIGGFLVDAILGIRFGAILFSLLVAAGQIVFALGAFLGQFWLMITGRFIFGLGGENLAVCQNLYSALWFKGDMLNMVFGIQLSIARLGSSVNLWTMEPIYQQVDETLQPSNSYVGLGIALFIGAIMCAFSLLCASVLMGLDRYAGRVLRRPERQEKVTLQDLKKIREVASFPLQFWLICAICVFYYVAVFPFVSLAQTFFIMKYGMDAVDANTVNSLVYFLSLAASPLSGFIIDRTGRNVVWILAGCLLTVGAHGMLAFLFVNPYVCTVIMGISYSILASSLWPLVAYVMPEENLGTAYGVMQAVQNLGLALMPMLAGFVVDGKGFLVLEIIFLLCLFAALSCTLVLWIVDDGRGGHLNMTAKARTRYFESKQD